MTTTYGQGQIRRQHQPDAYLSLVTIYTPTPIRIVNNNVDIISRGDTFSAMPFSIGFSADDGESIQQVKLTLDNVSLEMIDWVRTLTTPISVMIESIFSGAPDAVEQSVSNLVIRLIDYDAFSITATLGADDDLNQSIPSDKYTALQWPGLY